MAGIDRLLCMKTLLLLFLSIQSAFASLQLKDLQVGDMLLIPLNCYSCSIIESETDSRYSHSAVVLKNMESGKLVITEALLGVGEVDLKSFLGRVRPGHDVDIYRPKEWRKLSSLKKRQLEKKLWSDFKKKFEGLSFDPAYLWNNRDENGKEKLYCSEYLAKLLNPYLKKDIPVKPMDFRDNWDFWYRQYEGDVPQGQPGNGPGDIEHSRHFLFLDSLRR